MSGKNILKNNRVFLADRNNENKQINIYTTVAVNFSGRDTKLYVDDTSNFAESGELISVSSLTRVKYSSKGDNYFNISRNYENNAFIGVLFRVGVQLKQERLVAGKELAGWYVDGKTADATLKVGPANVITPGAIRFVESEKGNGQFQGCVSVMGDNVEWVNFNASEGRAGKDANINTCLRYECIGSGEGQLFNTDGVNVNSCESDFNSVRVRSITADKKIINGHEVEGGVSVRTVGDDVLIGLGDVAEVVYDLTAEFNDIKGKPKSDEKLNCYGEQIRVRVCPGEKVHKGQVVAIGLFKDNQDSSMYYGVRGITISETGKELLKYQVGSNICYKYSFGLSRMNGSDGEIIQVLVRGIGLLRIGNNISGMNTISSVEGRYLGEPVLLDRDGYGFICQDISKLPDTYMELGGIMEEGKRVGETDNYVLIKFNPVVVDL